MPNLRTTRRLAWIGIPVLVVIAIVAFWNWDWFIPIAESRASAALGRPVKMTHLHVHLGRVVQVTVDGLEIANPPNWPDRNDPPFVTVKALTVQVNALGYVEGHGLVIPMIGLDTPRVLAKETKDGNANFRLPTGGGNGKSSSGPSPRIGDLRINDGEAHLVIPNLKADFTSQINTQGEGNDAKLLVNAKGAYAGQPITGQFVGGALLSLRDKQNPWPVDLNVQNGPTKVSINGTLLDPVAFEGANLKLRLAGPDMGLLEPLVGFPIPRTPPYQIGGQLQLNGLTKIRFENFQGRLGSSDLSGTIEEQPGETEVNNKPKPVVNLDLRSNRVDLADLNGFLGGMPGSANSKNETPEQKKEIETSRHSSKLLPDTPISVPRLNWADIHLRYRAAHIEGKNMPMDSMAVVMDVVNGAINVHPITLGVGKGQLLSNIELTPRSDKSVRARMDLHMQNLDVSRMMAATHTFEGAGTVSGVGAIDASGDSIASLLGDGNGEIKMAMAGGDLSAILVDLTGLQFGKALLSALGIPQKTQVQCFVGDLALQNGLVDFKALTLDTKEAITNVDGNISLTKETIDLGFKTDAKHFSIGSLPTRINITGTFKDPKIRPGAEVAVRAGAAAGLAVLFVPLAILPTIQFGTSQEQDNQCNDLLQQARQSAGGKALPPPQRGTSSER